MTPEQAVAIVVALTGLLAAVGIVIHNVGELRRDVNGRLQELLDEARLAAAKTGELRGRDHALQAPPRVPRTRRPREAALPELHDVAEPE